MGNKRLNFQNTLSSEHIVVAFPTDDPKVVNAAKRIVEALPKKHLVSPDNTRITVVFKKPRKSPKVVASLDKKDPEDLVNVVKKIPVSRPSRENALPKLVRTIKTLMKDARRFRPRVPKYVVLLTKQNRAKPTKVNLKPSTLTAIPVRLKKVSVVPVGPKTVKPVLLTSNPPTEVRPVKPVHVPRVINTITRGEYTKYKSSLRPRSLKTK